MSKAYYIVDTELPISQNFRLLKEEGLAYIQAISGNEWTNLNTSDPGVTILDQLCYALTELGYCNDFPVKDILTDKDNRLKVKHQFYHPDGILTTTPITIVDYRKYVIDGIDGVKNVIITPVKKGCCSLNGVYRTYFLKKPSLTNTKAIESLPDEVFYLLNTARNLSESFLLPQPLSSKACSLSGRIDIETINGLGHLLEQLQECINDFIFPSVPQYGYDELLELGETTNDVFSGPILKNGWIRNEELGDKKNC
ncbi:MAG: hypothetical protein K0U54_01190, partial [Bacteroidetes bacterium]|nr:hypothetical protein [Bacteroidota bacterium]